MTTILRHNGTKWEEIINFDTLKGEKGDPADVSQVRPIADALVTEHERHFDHSQIDPFLIGSKTLSEAGMSDGMVIQYDAKANKLVYATVKQVASQISKLGRGLSLPSQSNNEDRFLTTDGTRSSWGLKITVSATQPSDPRLYDLWLDIS